MVEDREYIEAMGRRVRRDERYLQIYEMDVDEPDPFQIGTPQHHELIHFLRWEDRPMLRW